MTSRIVWFLHFQPQCIIFSGDVDCSVVLAVFVTHTFQIWSRSFADVAIDYFDLWQCSWCYAGNGQTLRSRLVCPLLGCSLPRSIVDRTRQGMYFWTPGHLADGHWTFDRRYIWQTDFWQIILCFDFFLIITDHFRSISLNVSTVKCTVYQVSICQMSWSLLKLMLWLKKKPFRL